MSVVPMPSVQAPPQHLDAERHVLCACLSSPDVLAEIAAILRPEDFYSDAHSAIYASILRRYEAGEPIDPLLVQSDLNADESLSRFVPGVNQLAMLLINTPPIPVEAVADARMIRDAAVLRRLMHAGRRIADEASRPGAEPDIVTAMAREEIERAAMRPVGEDDGPTPTEWFEAELVAQADGRAPAVADTPWPLVNQAGIMAAGEMTVLGGVTSHGKSAVALAVAWHNARSGRRVYYWSGEMSRPRLYQRLAAQITGVPLSRIVSRTWTAQEIPLLREAMQAVEAAPLHLCDREGLRIAEIEADVRRISVQHGAVSLVVIDYLGLTGDLNETDQDAERRDIVVGRAAWRALGIAKRLGCHVLLLHQLSGKPSQRFTSEPRLSDFRDSRQVEQHAHMAWLVYWPDRDDALPESIRSQYEERVQLTLAKARQGAAGAVWLRWTPESQRLDPLERQWWPRPVMEAIGAGRRRKGKGDSA